MYNTPERNDAEFIFFHVSTYDVQKDDRKNQINIYVFK